MKGSIFISWDDNEVPQHWVRDDVDDEQADEELHEDCYYDWESEMADAVVEKGFARVVSTTTGEVGYASRGRLLIPARRFGGRSPDRFRMSWLPTIKKVA